MRLILTLALLIALQHPALADECNTTLKESDSYQELSIILNCLSNKIQNLEAEIKSTKHGGSTQTDNSTPTLLDNKYMTVFDLNVSRRKGRIYTSFIIKSKYDKDIYLCILHDSPIITDEFGVSSSYGYSTKGLNDRSKSSTKEDDYTVLNPGVPTPVSIDFSDDAIKGNILSLRIGLLQLIGEKPTNYSFGKTNIRLEKQ